MAQPGFIGKPRVKVEFLQRSPFYPIQRQEWSYFFDEGTYNAIKTGIQNRESELSIDVLKQINGFRISEKKRTWNNRLRDATGAKLDDASVDMSSATVYANAKSNPTIDGKQELYIDWELCNGLFKIDNFLSFAVTNKYGNSNSSVQNINGTEKVCGIPSWQNTTLNLEGYSPTQIYVSASPPLKTLGVHWGLNTRSLYGPQPFEIRFDKKGNTYESVTDTKAPDFDGMDKNIAKKMYFAVRFGVTQDSYMLMFSQGQKPQLLQMLSQGSIQSTSTTGREPGEDGAQVDETSDKDITKASVIAEWSNFPASNLFSSNNNSLIIQVEPIGNNLYITSNLTTEPWVVSVEDMISYNDIWAYGGNCSGSIYLRPVQYLDMGSFYTPEEEIVVLKTDNQQPFITVSLKGAAEIEQNRNPGMSSGGEQETIESQGEACACDAESFNGTSIAPFYKASEKAQTDRAIYAYLLESAVENPEDAEMIRKKYYANVILRSSKLGVVENGRSPYIWQLRGILPASLGGADTGTGTDISCAVTSVNLTWNASSINEINQTGSFKVINRPSIIQGIDFTSYTNRTVYVRISAWWEGGAGKKGGSTVLFTGMTTSPNIEVTADKEVITFGVTDFMAALEGAKFVNSPYYDGMQARMAVRDIVRQLGLADAKILMGNTTITNSSKEGDGKDFVLPFVDAFEKPQFRFEDGSSYKEAINKIARIDGRCFYFDNEGNFHYESIPGGTFGEQNTVPGAEFYTNVSNAPTLAQCCWNMISYKRAIQDTFNIIKVSTVDKDTGALIHIGETNEPALHDAQAEGYAGYRKIFMLRDPSLGGLPAAIRYFDTYRKLLFIPPMTASFEAFGYPGLRPSMIIKVDGTKIRIVNITYDLNAEEKRFWMNVEGEWFFSQDKTSELANLADQIQQDLGR